MNIKSSKRHSTDRSTMLAAIQRAEKKESDPKKLQDLQNDRITILSCKQMSVEEMAIQATKDLAKAKRQQSFSSTGIVQFWTSQEKGTAGLPHVFLGVAGAIAGGMIAGSGIAGSVGNWGITLSIAGGGVAGLGLGQAAHYLGHRMDKDSAETLSQAKERLAVVGRWGGHSDVTNFGHTMARVNTDLEQGEYTGFTSQ